MKKKKRHNEIKRTLEAVALREIRKDKGYSLKFVAEKLGRSESYLRHIETGRRDFPRRKVLLTILEVLSISYKVFRHKVTAIRKEKIVLSDLEYLKALIEEVPKEKIPELKKVVKGFL